MQKALLLPGLSILIACIGYLFSNSFDLGLCFSNAESNTFDVSCHSFYENLGNPLLYGASTLAFVFLLLAFMPRAWRAWKMFAIWYLPLAICLFLFSRDPGSGDFLTPYPETVYRWVGGIFVVISLIIIFANAKGQMPQTNKKDGALIGNRYLQILWYAYIALLLYSAVRFLLSD